MKQVCLHIIFFLCLGAWHVHAQTATEKRDEAKRETNIRGNRFKIVNNYVNFGGGIGRRFLENAYDIPVAAAYNFRVKNMFFQAGYLRSTMPGFSKTLSDLFVNDLHFCINIRRENKVVNISYVIGPSLAYGLYNNQKFSHLGVYAEAQLIRKLFYDIGIGLCPFIAYNVRYPLGGLRLEIFLSGAYQGRLNAE
ncbi:MAG: hypothetical protein ACK5CV_11320 [Bacteroidota bacterium]|jgi:hypothetical protein